MPNTYLVLSSVFDVAATLQSATWTPYARFVDRSRQDSAIHEVSAVKQALGELWVNAGEWSPTRGYLNEEWVKPAFIYIKHRCDGCNYPPNMCCLQPSPRYEYDSFYEVSDLEDPDENDWMDEAIAHLYEYPAGVYPRSLVI